MDHKRLWISLKEMDVPQHLIVLMCIMYCGQKTTIRTEFGETEWVSYRQKCQVMIHFISPFVYSVCKTYHRKTSLDSGGGMKLVELE